MGGTFVNLKLWIQLSEILRYMSCFIIGEFILPPLFSFLPPRFTFLPSLFFLSLFSFLSPLVSFLPVSLYTQYWYYQYFPESSSICNTGMTSIF